MRIIGGKHKRRKLLSVPGIDTRPTTDRVRETLFNILSSDIPNAFVLDIYAGTGALGLEALSRGAKYAAFFEFNPKALSIIKRNIATLKEEQNSRVVKCDATKKISFDESFKGKFDLVFMDPPYDKDMVKKTLVNLNDSKLLANGAICVVEHSKKELIEDIENFTVHDERVYGRTKVSFINYND